MEKTIQKSLSIINENERLIANILHDIKSPLLSIKIVLQGSLKKELDNEINGTISKDIYATILEVLNYIENYLVNYSFKTGKFENKITPCDIKNIIKTKLEADKYLFIEKNVYIDLILNDDNYIINSINIFLSSVIGNIISNMACHASPNQRATIEVIRKKGYVETIFKNSFDENVTCGFHIGLEMIKRLANTLKADFKFTKSKNEVCVNLKIPNLD